MSPADDVKKVLREEMDSRGWHDDDWRAGLAAIIGGESGFVPKWETGYAHTSDARIRQFFMSRVHNLSDAQLNEIKATDESWFNFIYGPSNSVGRGLGNVNPDDGYRFRGGGLIQLTGRSNYGKYGQKAGVDLIAHPELIVAPRIAAAVAVEYMKDCFHGGDFDAMKRAVGVSLGNPDDEKNKLYDLFDETGEWDFKSDSPRSEVVPAKAVVYDPIVTAFLEATGNLQRFLTDRHLYTGTVDDDAGPGTRVGLKVYMKQVA